MNEANPPAASISPSGALDTVYRDLVGIHYGLAEHGPNDPEIARWAMHELTGVLTYLQAVRKDAQSAERS